jgi:hypothetical protein
MTELNGLTISLSVAVAIGAAYLIRRAYDSGSRSRRGVITIATLTVLAVAVMIVFVA